MIEVYHCTGARSLRALWMLEEMELPYRVHVLPFPPRRRQDGYLGLNPLGTVPLFVDGPTRMTESSAIVHYLGTRYGPTNLVVNAQEPAYGDYLNFLFMGEATLTFPQTIYFRYTRLEPEERRAAQAAEDYRVWFLARLRAAAALMGPRYACAGRFTAADISIGYALVFATMLGLAEDFPAGIADYYAGLRERAAFGRASKQ